MKQQIRHRRLHAFYRSKVLNSLMMVTIVSLLLTYTAPTPLPVICGSLAFLFFIGYSLWFWIKKPGSIVVNDRLSEISSMYTLYFLIIAAIDSPGRWWSIVPVALAVVLLFILLVVDWDEEFEI